MKCVSTRKDGCKTAVDPREKSPFWREPPDSEVAQIIMIIMIMNKVIVVGAFSVIWR